MKTKEEIIKDLNELIGFYKSRKHFSNTVSWLEFIKTNFENSTFSDYDKDFTEVNYSIRNTFTRFGRHVNLCYKEIESIFKFVLIDPNKFTSLLNDAEPYIKDWSINQGILDDVNTIKNRINKITEKESYYLTCFEYVLSVEGNYENWIKILYYLVKNYADNETHLEEINEDSLYDACKYLYIKGIDMYVFCGYESGHLRNSIAHSHLNYLDQERAMIFEDYKGNKLTYYSKLTLKEFNEKLIQLNIIPEICVHFIFILKLMDIKNAIKRYKKMKG